MSLGALLVQSIVIERSSPGVEDEWGNPVMTWAAIASVAGSIQPKKATEVPLQSQGGATMTDTVIYLLPTDVLAADRIRLFDDTDGPYYEITGVRDAAGRGHHLELDARLVK